jgi:hypothetical protein
MQKEAMLQQHWDRLRAENPAAFYNRVMLARLGNAMTFLANRAAFVREATVRVRAEKLARDRDTSSWKGGRAARRLRRFDKHSVRLGVPA